MFKHITLISLSLLCTACFSGKMENSKKEARSYEARHPIQVLTTKQTMEIPLNPDKSALDSHTTAKIRSFIYGYSDKGESNITIHVPETGIKATAARIATKQIIDIVTEAGIEQEHVAIKTYQPQTVESGSIRLSFNKNIAKAPNCRDKWSENLSDAYRNTAWKGLGCATRSNLAAMIARPNDLEEMQPISGGSAERRVTAMDKFVLGQPSAAARDASEMAKASQ